jgi:hypothetical protein
VTLVLRFRMMWWSSIFDRFTSAAAELASANGDAATGYLHLHRPVLSSRDHRIEVDRMDCTWPSNRCTRFQTELLARDRGVWSDFVWTLREVFERLRSLEPRALRLQSNWPSSLKCINFAAGNPECLRMLRGQIADF